MPTKAKGKNKEVKKKGKRSESTERKKKSLQDKQEEESATESSHQLPVQKLWAIDDLESEYVSVEGMENKAAPGQPYLLLMSKPKGPSEDACGWYFAGGVVDASCGESKKIFADQEAKAQKGGYRSVDPLSCPSCGKSTAEKGALSLYQQSNSLAQSALLIFRLTPVLWCTDCVGKIFESKGSPAAEALRRATSKAFPTIWQVTCLPLIHNINKGFDKILAEKIDSDKKDKEKRNCSNTSCTQPGTKRCTSCSKAFYCSKTCQKVDWKVHKVSCKPQG